MKTFKSVLKYLRDEFTARAKTDERIAWRHFLEKLPDQRKETKCEALAKYFEEDPSSIRDNYKEIRAEYISRQ
jgi:hypothetical protein